MSKLKTFPFGKARRVSAQETKSFKKAIEEKLGVERPSRGRPKKTSDKYQAIAIRLHPKILLWAKKEAKRRGVGYQTVINEVLWLFIIKGGKSQLLMASPTRFELVSLP